MATSPRTAPLSPRPTQAQLPVTVYHHPESLDELERYDAYEQDAFTAGISRRWTFFNCSTCEMTLEIAGAEHYYILEGECTVEHEGRQEPVVLKAGDFVELRAGKALFKVEGYVRMFFTEEGKTTYTAVSMNHISA